MALPTREGSSMEPSDPSGRVLSCDPAGCDYDLKGALCSMPMRRLEAAIEPGCTQSHRAARPSFAFWNQCCNRPRVVLLACSMHTVGLALIELRTTSVSVFGNNCMQSPAR